jgi:hypothetical protein
LLRPIAVGFILFFVIRAVSFERLISRLERTGAFAGFARSFRAAVRVLKEI